MTTYQFSYDHLAMKTMAMLHKVVEPERIIYVWSSLTNLPNQAMSFYEDRIFMIDRPESAADAVQPPLANPESVFRILYRIHAEENRTLEAPEEDVLRTQCDKVSQYFQTAEATLLEKTRCNASVVSTFSSMRSLKALEDICETEGS